MDDILVKAVELRKKYGSFEALQGLNLNVPSGKIFGLLGPNGSGKTTLIKIMAGLLTANGGEVFIEGNTPGEQTKAIVSYLPERPYFNSWMRVDECLDYFQDFYADFDRILAEKMLADLGVPTDKKLKALSKGTKEKVQLVLVMSRHARLYLLDEPIAGVDPVAREYILRTIISTYNKEASVIISTHLITDVEAILDEYAFIWNGRVVEQGDVRSIREERGVSLDDRFKEVFRCFPNS